MNPLIRAGGFVPCNQRVSGAIRQGQITRAVRGTQNSNRPGCFPLLGRGIECHQTHAILRRRRLKHRERQNAVDHRQNRFGIGRGFAGRCGNQAFESSAQRRPIGPVKHRNPDAAPIARVGPSHIAFGRADRENGQSVMIKAIGRGQLQPCQTGCEAPAICRDGHRLGQSRRNRRRIRHRSQNRISRARPETGGFIRAKVNQH